LMMRHQNGRLKKLMMRHQNGRLQKANDAPSEWPFTKS